MKLGYEGEDMEALAELIKKIRALPTKAERTEAACRAIACSAVPITRFGMMDVALEGILMRGREG